MAISLSRLKQQGAKEATSRRLQKEFAEQQARESKRKGWSSLLGGVGGKLLGTALAGMTGGLAAPLLMAAGTFGGKVAAHKMTESMAADTSGLKEGQYGYGKQEAKTLKEGLEAQVRASDPMKQRGGFGRDLIGAYGSAALAGELGGVKGLLKGGEGAPSLKEALVGKDGFKGFTGSKEALFGKAAVVDPGNWETDISGLEFNPVSGEYRDPEGFALAFQEGGQVPNQQQQLMQMLALQKLLNPTAYDNTVLEGEEQQTANAGDQLGVEQQQQQQTIAEYFGAQNKTLGGSNTKSLSQMLGR